jgi:hypothetical protein
MMATWLEPRRFPTAIAIGSSNCSTIHPRRMRRFAVPPHATPAIMADWQIERLAKSNERTGFSRGKPSLDDFIRTLVSPYEKRNLGRTYVAVRPDETQVCGYYWLASGAGPFLQMPAPAAKNLP